MSKISAILIKFAHQIVKECQETALYLYACMQVMKLIPKGWKVITWFRYLHTNRENFEDPMC